MPASGSWAWVGSSRATRERGRAWEVIGGVAIYDVPSLEEAKEWTRRFLQVHIDHFPGWDCEVEIRQMMDDPPPTTVDVGGGLSR